MSGIKLSFNKDWKFFRGEPPKGRVVNSSNPHDHGLSPFDIKYDFSAWETVCLPHSVRNEKLNCSGGLNYQGCCWYCKNFYVPANYEGKELYFELDGAMQRVDAWLDGRPLGMETGGFLPMRFYMNRLSVGAHVLALRVDNSDMGDVPPAKPQGALDFCYFGGLYRNAWFYALDKVRFSYAVHEGKPQSGGLFVKYELRSGDAEVFVRANWLNHTDKDVAAKVELFLNGDKVFSGESMTAKKNCDCDAECKFIVNSPSLWSTEHPYLYRLTARLIVDGAVADEREEKIGIRTIEFREDGFYLNGEKLFLNGTNRHQEFPYVGFALSDSLQIRDVKVLRAAGVNCIRTAHYPMDEVFASACDEAGILCVIPTPGWQIHPLSVAFDEASYQNTRRMIRLLRNHPSTMLWEPILNETDFPEYFGRTQLAIVREECALSAAWCGCDQFSRCAEDFSVNYGTETKRKGVALFVREYGDFYMEQYGPMDTLRRVRRGKNVSFYPGGEKAMIRSAQERFDTYRQLRQTKNLSGACSWAAIDHNRGYEPTEGAVGMLDFFRLPKFDYNYFDCRQDFETAGGKCYIANFRGADSPKDITVYSNGDEVRLSLGGESLGTIKTGGEKGIHPAVTFAGVPDTAGELKAEALIGGKVVARYSVYSQLEPKKLKLVPMWAGVDEWVADGSDMLLVHAFVTDKNGTTATEAEPELSFFVQGDARIVGKDEPWINADKIKAEAGIGAVLLKAGKKAGEVVLTVCAEGLRSDEIRLVTVPDTKKYIGGPDYAETMQSPCYPCDEREYFSERENSKNYHTRFWDVSSDKPATASSCADGLSAENVNRKSIGEPWIAKDNTFPQWWQCDFGEEYNVNGVMISWESDGKWYDYDVMTSLDGENWTEKVKGHASGQTRLPDRFDKPSKARFCRIVINSVSGSVAAGMYRVEVFAKPITK